MSEPDERNQVKVQMFSVIDPNAFCTQLLTAFETIIPLGSVVNGSYTVFVNDEKVGSVGS